MRQLQQIRDDPQWVFVDPLGRTVVRRLRAWSDGGDAVVVLVTEQGAGMSITNAAVQVLRAVAALFPGKDVMVVEHYPHGAGVPEHFDQVGLDATYEPRWRRLPGGAVRRILGLPQTAGAGSGWPGDLSPRFQGWPGLGAILVSAADGAPVGVITAERGRYTWGGGPGDRLLAADLLRSATGRAAVPSDVDVVVAEIVSVLDADGPWAVTRARLGLVLGSAV